MEEEPALIRDALGSRLRRFLRLLAHSRVSRSVTQRVSSASASNRVGRGGRRSTGSVLGEATHQILEDGSIRRGSVRVLGARASGAKSRGGAFTVHGAAGGGRAPALPVSQGGPADATPIRAGDSRRVDGARDACGSIIRPQLTHRSGNGGGERWNGGRSNPGIGTMEKQLVQAVYVAGRRSGVALGEFSS